MKSIVPSLASTFQRWFPHALLIVLAGACTSEGQADGERIGLGQGTTITGDLVVANGIPSHRHSADAFERATQLTIDPEPIAVLGGADGDGEFDLTYATSVVLLSDGRIATLAPVGNRLLIFDRNGRGERSLRSRSSEGARNRKYA